MTDKEKINEEIKQLKEINLDNHAEGYAQACDDMLSSINSVQELSVNEDLEEASRKYADDHYADYLNSEEGEENYWCSYFSFKAGANYYKQQMLKNSVSRVVHIGEDSYPFLQRYELAYDIKTQIPDINEGDKVKLIIIKED